MSTSVLADAKTSPHEDKLDQYKRRRDIQVREVKQKYHSTDKTAMPHATGLSIHPIAHPSGVSLGAEIRDADLINLSDNDFAKIEEAFYTYNVILFKNQQSLPPSAQYELTRRFDPSALKPLALDRGYVGGVYKQPLLGDTQASERSVTTVYTNNSVATYHDGETGEIQHEYQERVRKENNEYLESSYRWSHR